jgi:hypothetical protein
LVLVIWTIGAATLWFVANESLNVGVTESDIQECREEGIIPAAECEETLKSLEAEESPVIGYGASLAIWLIGCFLLWLATRPATRPDDERQGELPRLG